MDRQKLGVVLAKPRELERCRALRDRGLRCEFQVGSRIARGFADLGCEEFQVIAPEKIVSLFTGQTSAFTSDQHSFFFHIPTSDQLVDLIQQRGYDVKQLEFVDQRVWRLSYVPAHSAAAESASAVRTFEAATIKEVLLDGLLACIAS